MARVSRTKSRVVELADGGQGVCRGCGVPRNAASAMARIRNGKGPRHRVVIRLTGVDESRRAPDSPTTVRYRTGTTMPQAARQDGLIRAGTSGGKERKLDHEAEAHIGPRSSGQNQQRRAACATGPLVAIGSLGTIQGSKQRQARGGGDHDKSTTAPLKMKYGGAGARRAGLSVRRAPARGRRRRRAAFGLMRLTTSARPRN